MERCRNADGGENTAAAVRPEPLHASPPAPPPLRRSEKVKGHSKWSRSTTTSHMTPGGSWSQGRRHHMWIIETASIIHDFTGSGVSEADERESAATDGRGARRAHGGVFMMCTRSQRWRPRESARIRGDAAEEQGKTKMRHPARAERRSKISRRNESAVT